ncbi:MAG: hypothetical protein WDN31_19915 [Hyphomicrobium sp.]
MRQRLPSFALAAIAGATLFANVAAAQDWNPFDPFQNPTRGQADERQQPAARAAPAGRRRRTSSAPSATARRAPWSAAI